MGADRDRALEVIERAIEAMGGRKRLLAIKEMSAMVWIEVNLKELRMPSWQNGVPLSVISVNPYLYPVATWHYEGWGNHAVAKKRKIQSRGFLRSGGPQPVLCEQRSQATTEDIRDAL